MSQTQNQHIIETVTINPGAIAITEGNSAETWKGTALYHSQCINIYIKIQPPQELIAEVVAAIAGRANGLNIPKPFIAEVNKQDLPYAKVWKKTHSEKILAVAMQDAEAISVKQYVTNPKQQAELLLQWESYHEACIFDEWIANMDRNNGNILYDGEFYLIDHGHALTGPGWPLWPLDPNTECNNDLIRKREPSLSAHERYQWRKSANTLAKQYHQNTPFDLLDQWISESGFSIENQDTIIPFLQMRTISLIDLLCQKLKIPQLPMDGMMLTGAK